MNTTYLNKSNTTTSKLTDELFFRVLSDVYAELCARFSYHEYF